MSNFSIRATVQWKKQQDNRYGHTGFLRVIEARIHERLERPEAEKVRLSTEERIDSPYGAVYVGCMENCLIADFKLR